MSVANPLWGAPRIHGELLKLGNRCRADHGGKIHGEEKTATVAGLEDLSAQSCRRHCVDGFVRRPDDLVSAVVWISDLLQHSRRQLLWLGVTARPSAHWIARQLTEAYGWQQAPRYIVRDRDCVYGDVVIQRLQAMGISADLATVAMAKWIFGEANRFNPTGLS
jgi:hypothetical protein